MTPHRLFGALAPFNFSPGTIVPETEMRGLSYPSAEADGN